MDSWKVRLEGRMDPDLAKEIDVFEQQMALRVQDKVDEKVFAETRLRRGAYGQRYDNGRRDDGTGPKPLGFPRADVFKGPDTFYDAPGMMRIKIPMGRLSADQLEMLADLAEEVSDGIVHITTRQDVQLHFVQLDDTPDLMRRLASVGITTREACGNSVRNVTACPLAGVCLDEAHDVTGAADALAQFMLGHPDAQDFGRKFKATFSGCQQHACGMVAFHDLGLVAREEDGVRGFEVWVGGGLGAVPRRAVLYAQFMPEAELLSLAQAMSRVFARMGEKRNRAKARLKFLVAKLGIEEFRRIIEEERAGLKEDPAWSAWLQAPDQAWVPIPPDDIDDPPADLDVQAFDRWRSTNVYAQRQSGWSAVTISLPLGDLTSTQTRGLADLVRPLGDDCVRTTVEQNVLLRWVPDGHLPRLFSGLQAAGLAAPGAGSIVDVTACPGTDTCKLGIASSRGLAAVLRERLSEKAFELDEAVRGLRIKVSGCFNSCAQHQVADIGFYGVSRNSGGYAVPHFQVVLGGKWDDNARAFGMAMCAVPSKRIPEVVDLLTDAWMNERQAEESFQAWTQRLGKVQIKGKLAPLSAIPSFAVAPELFTDWADDRVFTLGDLGVGECAGEVVSLAEFGLAEAERLEFEAQVRQESGDHEAAGAAALASMVEAAKALLKQQDPDVEEDADWVVDAFRTRVYDKGLFHDPYAGAKFAQYLFRQHDGYAPATDVDDARQRIDEAQLFIEAAHACQNRLIGSTP